MVQNFENREKEIKDLDTGMSPFMKNQNEHMQRMKNIVAKQDAVTRQYHQGKLTNLTIADQHKDMHY